MKKNQDINNYRLIFVCFAAVFAFNLIIGIDIARGFSNKWDYHENYKEIAKSEKMTKHDSHNHHGEEGEKRKKEDDDHENSEENEEEDGENSGIVGQSSSNKEEGNEATGLITALLVLCANLTVVISLLIKLCVKIVPLSAELKKNLIKFNISQKKRLMWLHYFLNPVAFGFAAIHFSLSSCKSTFLPECGIFLMALLVVLGLIVKFNKAPESLRKFIIPLHTHPLSLVIMVAVLMIGHTFID